MIRYLWRRRTGRTMRDRLIVLLVLDTVAYPTLLDLCDITGLSGTRVSVALDTLEDATPIERRTATTGFGRCVGHTHYVLASREQAETAATELAARLRNSHLRNAAPVGP